MKIKDVDRGYKALLRRLLGVKQIAITVGIHAGAGAAEAMNAPGRTVVQIASYNEFGVPDRIRARSFVRGWYDDFLDRNRANLRKLAVATVKQGSDSRALFDKLGVLFVGQMQKRISDRIPPKNASSTIARKGSSIPLINTGQLRSSIAYEIEGAP